MKWMTLNVVPGLEMYGSVNGPFEFVMSPVEGGKWGVSLKDYRKEVAPKMEWVCDDAETRHIAEKRAKSKLKELRSTFS